MEIFDTYIWSGIQRKDDVTGFKVNDMDVDLKIILAVGQNGDPTEWTVLLRTDRPPGLDDNRLIQADRHGRKKTIIFQLIFDRNNAQL